MGKRRSEQKYIGRGGLLARWGISAMTLERRLKNDQAFPKTIRFEDGERARRYWLLAEVERYEQSKVSS